MNESSTPGEDSDPPSVCDVALETGDDEQTPSDCIQRLPASNSQLEPEGNTVATKYGHVFQQSCRQHHLALLR